ncbi:hypothetical protein O0I10_000525 [Lichtheimia ornata]|uniref:Integrase zinc-binding domain-containing protein n=1 Tax=Lichtheimia ornata TaxID=688661 RepID=A0AAD8DJ00_9FUNG|nr:uncharacterized protein O0I10_000525 [Lichtheimia ornata]KAJ8663287.1 hypothetical protein O0I10_000525 [Lichtheimia ornata]
MQQGLFVIETDASDFGVGAVLFARSDIAALHSHVFEYVIEYRSGGGDGSSSSQVFQVSFIKPTPPWQNRAFDILSRRDGAHCLTNESDMEPEYLYATRAIQESDWPKFYLRPEEKWPSSYADLLRKHREQFVVRNDMVFRKVKVNNTLQEVRFAMFSRRADIVQEIHKAFGHPGMTTMQDLVRKRWWWPNMKQDIQEWIAQCSQCQLAAGADRNNHHAPITLTEIACFFSLAFGLYWRITYYHKW